MIRRTGLAIMIAAAFACVSPGRAEAASTRLNLNAGYWFDIGGLFSLDFSVDTPVASFLSVGGRFGAAVVTEGPRAGIPLDLLVRIHLPSPLYLEITGGPWIFFNTGDDLRGHFGFGVGINSGGIGFGVELSYLEPDPVLSGRLSFRL